MTKKDKDKDKKPEETHFRNTQDYLDYVDGDSEYGRSEGTQMRDKHGKPMFDRWGRPMIVPGTPKPGEENNTENNDDGGGDDDRGGKKKRRFRW